MINYKTRMYAEGSTYSHHMSVLADYEDKWDLPLGRLVWQHLSVTPFPYKWKSFEKMWDIQIFKNFKYVCIEL